MKDAINTKVLIYYYILLFFWTKKILITSQPEFKTKIYNFIKKIQTTINN